MSETGADGKKRADGPPRLKTGSSVGMSEIVLRTRRSLMSTANRQALAFDRGDGSWLVDGEGSRYLDMISGVGVSLLGHNAPEITEAIGAQAHRVLHASNHWYTWPQIVAAEELSRSAFVGRVFFCNSGAEANEAAIKLARKWAYVNERRGRTILCANESFHGRTLGALAATGRVEHGKLFHPLPGGFKHVDVDDRAQVEDAVTEDVVAILVEPIRGEAGVKPLADGTLKMLREICDRADLLLILDEVQTGVGRTGRFWAHEYAGITPDVMTSAKGLGGGIPVGAVLAGPRADVFEPGDHATTFGGNPLATAVAGAVLRTVREKRLYERAAEVGEVLVAGLDGLRDLGLPIEGVRGRGLMLGVILSADLAPLVVRNAIAEGVLLNAIGSRVIRLLPPLILTESEADFAVEAFERAVTSAMREQV